MNDSRAEKRYNLIFKGPALDANDERISKAARLLMHLAPFSEKEATLRLGKAPFTVIGGLRPHHAAEALKKLNSAGFSADLHEDNHGFGAKARAEIEPFLQTRHKYLADGSGLAIFSELATGLLILAVIALTGLMQITAAHTFMGREGTNWALSATGWGTIGLSIVGFMVLLLLKVGRMAAILKAPDRNTPISVCNSFLTAIADRHWLKAAACLAYRDDGEELAAHGFEEIKKYCRELHNEYVIIPEVDPAKASMLQFKDDLLTMRITVAIVSRKPQAEGSRIRRELVQVLRLAEIDGGWYILDAVLLGQRKPSRLPVPACLECGEEVILGQVSCPSCQVRLPPHSLENEQWISPRKKPDMAALLSAVIPGLGQVYNGQFLKGALIGATCWLILPWLVGIIDASVVADRINRRQSTHDLPSSIRINMAAYMVLFFAYAAVVIFNAGSLPVISEILASKDPRQQGYTPQTIVSRFKGEDGGYSILFPFKWNVQVPSTPEFTAEGDHVALRAYSEDGSSTVVITTRPVTPNWQPCPAAIEARRLLEEKGMEIANVECGTREGRKHYRLDSYSGDRRFRQSLNVFSIRDELVVIAFVCPIEDQDKMVDVYNEVVQSIQFVESSGITVKR